MDKVKIRITPVGSSGLQPDHLNPLQQLQHQFYLPDVGIDNNTKVPINPSTTIIILTVRLSMKKTTDTPIMVHISISDMILLLKGIDRVSLKFLMYLPNNLCRKSHEYKRFELLT
jgi:hypothetical protein